MKKRSFIILVVVLTCMLIAAVGFGMRSESLTVDLTTVKLPQIEGFENLKEQLLKDPESLLRDINGKRTFTEQERENLFKIWGEKVFDKPTHPLFGLNECTSDSCKLNRVKYSNVREDFLEHFLKYFKDKHPDNKKHITIMFFGSGDLFNECEIITNLAEHGYRNLTILCVDEAYKASIPFIRKHFLGLLKENKFEKLQKSNPSIIKAIQWISHLPGTYTLTFYDSIISYANDLQKSIAPQCDDIITIDPMPIFDGKYDIVGPNIEDNITYLKSLLKIGGTTHTLKRTVSKDGEPVHIGSLGTIEISQFKSLSEEGMQGQSLIQKSYPIFYQDSSNWPVFLKKEGLTSATFEKHKDQFLKGFKKNTYKITVKFKSLLKQP